MAARCQHKAIVSLSDRAVPSHTERYDLLPVVPYKPLLAYFLSRFAASRLHAYFFPIFWNAHNRIKLMLLQAYLFIMLPTWWFLHTTFYVWFPSVVYKRDPHAPLIGLEVHLVPKSCTLCWVYWLGIFRSCSEQRALFETFLPSFRSSYKQLHTNEGLQSFSFFFRLIIFIHSHHIITHTRSWPTLPPLLHCTLCLHFIILLNHFPRPPTLSTL